MVVNIDTTEEKEMLLKILEKKGYRWKEGQLPTEWEPVYTPPNLNIFIRGSKRLTCGSRSGDGISFKDFMRKVNCL